MASHDNKDGNMSQCSSALHFLSLTDESTPNTPKKSDKTKEDLNQAIAEDSGNE